MYTSLNKNQECKTNRDCKEGQRCRNNYCLTIRGPKEIDPEEDNTVLRRKFQNSFSLNKNCLLYTSDAADE